AAIDDFVATAVLLTMPNIELQGIVVTNADCIATPAMNTSWRVSQFFGIEHIPLTLSDARGWNSFPWEYRADCINMGTIDILKPFSDNKSWPPYPSGEAMMTDLLIKAIEKKDPVTILCTGPVTTITNLVSNNPTLLEGINEIVWMGGAVDVPGNLDPATIPAAIANKHAEWNAFWDPFAVDIMFRLFEKVRVFPLDITDQAKITPEFKARLLAQSEYPYSKFVYQAYDLVKDQPFYEMWNTCATVFLSGRTDIYAEPETTPLDIVLWGFEQGWIRRTDKPTMHPQLVYQNFSNSDNFYDYVLEQLKR
ncbi:MAG: nucleoside hydrolase, partial [Chitinophagaceae bacterium]|nr:nucleoside hydrolase [Chitinophagaceae bacterium]